MAIIKVDYGDVISRPMRDTFYDKVFNNSGYTIYPITVFDARCVINEGQVAVDTIRNTVYVYVDLSITVNKGTDDWWTLVSVSGLSGYYMPNGVNRVPITDRPQALITDEYSPTYKPLIANYHEGSQEIALMSPYGYGLTTDDHYICYGSWQYEEAG